MRLNLLYGIDNHNTSQFYGKIIFNNYKNLKSFHSIILCNLL